MTGTFYLQMPDQSENLNEGAIEFSHKGVHYPKGSVSFPTKIVNPKCRDMIIFPSSLFHRTLPFDGSKQRVCIAFDLVRRSGI